MIALIVGLIVSAVSIYTGLRYLHEVVMVLKGALPLMFLFGGILSIIAGATSIKDEMETKKPEQTQQNVESK